MSDVTRILLQIESGDPASAEKLLPLVYEELRKLAAEKMAQENPGQTLQATALVHEAFIRLVDVEQAQRWESRRHFFAAAAEAMRRILVDGARHKQRLKHGRGMERVDLDELQVTVDAPSEGIVALDEALGELAERHPVEAELVKLRYFAGMPLSEASEALGMSIATANRKWTYAKAWLYRQLASREDIVTKFHFWPDFVDMNRAENAWSYRGQQRHRPQCWNGPTDEQSIFSEALQKETPAARSAFLDRACGHDAALRRSLDSLLKAHGRAGDFLEVPAGAAAATLDSAPPAERPGVTIGRYKLLQEIGEGGMGVVYMAEQREPVRRKVALKVIKPGMDSRDVIVARFEAERQALALMDHPNVAHVLDAGATESGRPYFVMELVPGVPITTFCDQNELTTRERLELFVQVCQAVQHAHQKGIIHRDLKPSNVLVTSRDGVPVPKIIDFGVAKATNQQLTDKTVFTGFGQMVGTPLYMSPEQAELNCLDVDTPQRHLLAWGCCSTNCSPARRRSTEIVCGKPDSMKCVA